MGAGEERLSLIPGSRSWPREGGRVACRACTLHVADAGSFAPGDWVAVRSDFKRAFIDEHGMTGKWTTDTYLKGVVIYRQVTAADVDASTVDIDIPTRYPMKTRDNVRVYAVNDHLTECGVEGLSIGMRENLTPGLGDADWTVEGTGAYEVHGSHAVICQFVRDGWMRSVHTYRPSVNINDWHTQSNAILVQCPRNVTIRDCSVGNPQYKGDGGNGLGHTLGGSDCLILDSIAYDTRHNYDFKGMWTSGKVVFRCVARDGRFASDFHMHLSPANLFDSMVCDADFLQGVYRPYGGFPEHGQTTSQSVFWNTYGD